MAGPRFGSGASNGLRACQLGPYSHNSRSSKLDHDINPSVLTLSGTPYRTSVRILSSTVCMLVTLFFEGPFPELAPGLTIGILGTSSKAYWWRHIALPAVTRGTYRQDEHHPRPLMDVMRGAGPLLLEAASNLGP
jgi:hypothetical protein